MEPSIYRYIWRYSKREQLVVLIFTLVTFPLLYFSLEVPKLIINEALGGKDFPRQVLGVELEQIGLLLVLSIAYLLLVLVSGAIKMKVNIYKGIISERMMRRLRYQLIDRVLRFPRPHFRKVSQGELIPIVTAEVEPLGGLMGDAIAQPLLQTGQMLTILVFLFVQSPWLGLSAVALIPLQGYIIPKLQRQVNLLHREKVRKVRRLSERLSETVNGVQDIHLSATTNYTRSDFSNRLGEIYRVRFQMYKKKYFMKFVNNMMNNLTPFFFYAVGGYLVIQGQLTLGALVAALSAYKDLVSPWKELLNFYNQFMDSSIRYDAIIEKFEPEGLMDAERQISIPETIRRLDGDIELNNVSCTGGNTRALRNVSMHIKGGSMVAVIGTDDAGRENISQVISRTLVPSSGEVLIGGERLDSIPDAVTGSRIAYVGPDSYVFSGTIGDNIRLSLKKFPPKGFEITPKIKSDVFESEASGNSPYPFLLDWANYSESGFESKEEFNRWSLELFKVVSASDFLFGYGLDTIVDPAQYPELTDAIVQSRPVVASRLESDKSIGILVRRFDPAVYNSYASVAENILFGEPVDHRLTIEGLPSEPYFREVLEATGLTRRFQETGVALVDMMVEMFSGLKSGHPFYERYSFMDEALLPVLQDLQARRTSRGLEKLTTEENKLLIRGVCQLTPERHRLGLIDEDMQDEILRARKYFHDHLPPHLHGAIVSFNADEFLPNTSVLTNALVGRIAFSEAGAEHKVREVVQSVFDELGLRNDVELLVNEFPTGMGGAMLPIPGRERVALVRGLIKKPDVVVLNQALASFGDVQRAEIAQEIRNLLPTATIVWIDKSIPAGVSFDQVIEINSGHVFSSRESTTITKPEVPASPKEEVPSSTEVPESEADHLMHVPLFSSLPPNEVRLVALASERRVAAPGEVLFSEGDRADGVYTILEGDIEIVRSSNGRQEKLAHLGPGDTAGELSVICDRPRNATARVITEATVLFTTTEDVLTLLEHNPGVANTMLRYLSARFFDVLENRKVA